MKKKCEADLKIHLCTVFDHKLEQNNSFPILEIFLESSYTSFTFEN